MSKTDVRRIVFKWAVLVAMVGALLIYRSDTRAQYGSPACDNTYQYCVTQCMETTGGTSTECSYGACATEWFACWDNENPTPAQPQLPCPGCVRECDFNKQACIASGLYTSQQCSLIAYKCKYRCNYMCAY